MVIGVPVFEAVSTSGAPAIAAAPATDADRKSRRESERGEKVIRVLRRRGVADNALRSIPASTAEFITAAVKRCGPDLPGPAVGHLRT
jgi:hypothetical protein